MLCAVSTKVRDQAKSGGSYIHTKNGEEVGRTQREVLAYRHGGGKSSTRPAFELNDDVGERNRPDVGDGGNVVGAGVTIDVPRATQLSG